MNWPNRLTMLRIALALGTFVAFLSGSKAFHVAGLLMFVAALITDWVDGYIARRTNAVSVFGKVVDPIADKILVLGALIALTRYRDLDIPLWGVFLILLRELLMGGVRLLISSQGKIVGAERWGKWKMGVQGASVGLIMLQLILRENLPPDALPAAAARLPFVLICLSVAMTWFSAMMYFLQSRKELEKTWA